MTSEDVKRRVEAEIGAEWDRTSDHGCTIRRCLVEPELVSLADFENEGPIWLVLEEDPEERRGYKVFYDPESDDFGLAASTPGGPLYLGHYGSFLDAYDDM